MNQLFKKAMAYITAGVLAVSGLGMSSFAADKYETATVNYDASVSKPTYAIKGESGVRKVKLTSKTAGVAIYYTTDGSTPTTSSKKFVSGKVISIKKNTTLKAIAVKGSAKSSVMTKKVVVDTMIGDVTGDGIINEEDYSRLKNYLAGKTSYICTDNSDVNGDNLVNKKDLNLIKEYNDGDIDDFPVQALKTPTITVYKTYGGKRIEFSSKDSGVKFYFTVNGRTPTEQSVLYVPKKLIVDSDTTVKVIAVKGNSKSAVKTKDVTVDKCKTVTCDTPTDKNYTKKTDIKLSCATASSKIYYTLDGTDPRTSSTVKAYTGTISLTKDTVVKAYARSKGYADSEVATFSFKVKCGFTISGKVWNDTPLSTSKPDGIWKSGEEGINGIKVALYKANSSTLVATTTTATINGVAGSYTFTTPEDGSYQVAFEYNGQKYRAYEYVVSGGNQATCTALPAITVMKTGAYDNSNKLLTTINSYSSACVSSFFATTAKTKATYDREATDVNLALITNNYGSLALTMTTNWTGQSSANTIKNGDRVTYTIKLSNNSPETLLSDAKINVYVTSTLGGVTFSGSNIDYSYITTNSGYDYYEVSTGLGVSSGLRPGQSLTFTVTGIANAASANDVLACSAEVSAYKFSNSCYDKTSVPGNMTIGTAKESDEAVSTKLTITGGETAKELSISKRGLSTIANGGYTEYEFAVTNGTPYSNELIISIDGQSLKYSIVDDRKVADVRLLTLGLTGDIITSGTSIVTIYLKEDTSKSVTFSIHVGTGARG